MNIVIPEQKNCAKCWMKQKSLFDGDVCMVLQKSTPKEGRLEGCPFTWAPTVSENEPEEERISPEDKHKICRFYQITRVEKDKKGWHDIWECTALTDVYCKGGYDCPFFKKVDENECKGVFESA